MGEMPFLAPVQLAHLLQAHNVGIELFDGMTEVVNFQPAPRPDTLHTFVDVVGGNTQDIHAGPFCASRGNSKQASALDGEKQAWAAWR